MDKYKSKSAFLLDALKYYSVDPINRRCISICACYYSPITAHKPLSEGCLIGRNLDPVDALAIDKAALNISFGNSVINKVLELDMFKDKIPEKMRRFGSSFLVDCQSFHDDDLFWDTQKLSEMGRAELNVIIYKHKLNKSLFAKYLN